jgi:hypothetical protein
MSKEQLENLLNKACELLIVFEDSSSSTLEDKLKIQAIFNEIKYSDKIDSELNLLADEEVQDYTKFNNNKI